MTLLAIPELVGGLLIAAGFLVVIGGLIYLALDRVWFRRKG